MRYISRIKDWFQDVKSIIVIVISFVIGLGTGLATLQSLQSTMESWGIAIIAWIGTIVGIVGMFGSVLLLGS